MKWLLLILMIWLFWLVFQTIYQVAATLKQKTAAFREAERSRKAAHFTNEGQTFYRDREKDITNRVKIIEEQTPTDNER